MTAKIDVNVDFTHKICASMMLPSLRFLLLASIFFFFFICLVYGILVNGFQ